MNRRFDWKFFLTLAITIASVAVPIWLWQLDLTAKALALTVKSTAELQPNGIGSLDGAQLSVDGIPLQAPYVSVVELTNSGSKPILTSDFEGAIRISVESPSKLVKARMTSSTPLSLEPKISIKDGAVLLQPLLLNPGDTIRITAVTADAKPVFNASARVAGVTEFTVSDVQAGRETKRYWFGKIASTLLLMLYLINMSEFAGEGMRRRIFLPRSFATGVSSGLGGTLLVAIQTPENVSITLNMLTILSIATVLSLPFMFLLMRHGCSKVP